MIMKHETRFLLCVAFVYLQLKAEVEVANKAKETIVMRYANSEKEVIRQRKEFENSEKHIRNLAKEVEMLNKKTKMLNSERERLIHMVDSKVIIIIILIYWSLKYNLYVSHFSRSVKFKP